MCMKKEKEIKIVKAEIEAETLKAKDIQTNSLKVDGNFMIGDFTCNFVWNDDIGAYVLCGYKE